MVLRNLSKKKDRCEKHEEVQRNFNSICNSKFFDYELLKS